ncbi:MAG: hypothetical protein RR239_03480 [Oscillospiraceae bacterium]
MTKKKLIFLLIIEIICIPAFLITWNMMKQQETVTTFLIMLFSGILAVGCPIACIQSLFGMFGDWMQQ